MRWTQRCLRATGSQGGFPVSDNGRADEGHSRVQPSRVVLTPRRRRQVLRRQVGPTGCGSRRYRQGDGDKKARFTGESSEQLLRPLRAGMPGRSGEPVVTTLVWLLFFPREAAGASCARHSPRPLGRRFYHGPGEIAPRECEGVSNSVGWVERSDTHQLHQRR
jgi:hypothetical protein